MGKKRLVVCLALSVIVLFCALISFQFKIGRIPEYAVPIRDSAEVTQVMRELGGKQMELTEGVYSREYDSFYRNKQTSVIARMVCFSIIVISCFVSNFLVAVPLSMRKKRRRGKVLGGLGVVVSVVLLFVFTQMEVSMLKRFPDPNKCGFRVYALNVTGKSIEGSYFQASPKGRGRKKTDVYVVRYQVDPNAGNEFVNGYGGKGICVDKETFEKITEPGVYYLVEVKNDRDSEDGSGQFFTIYSGDEYIVTVE